MVTLIGHGRHQEDVVGPNNRIEAQRHKLTDTEVEIEEADVPKVPANVYTPSQQEYNRQCASHLLCRNWCPICGQAKKRKTRTQA